MDAAMEARLGNHAIPSGTRWSPLPPRALGALSHELRGPLQIINGYLDLVLAGMAGPLADEQRAALAHARAGGVRLLAAVDDLLLELREQRGPLPAPSDVVDLGDAAAAALDDARVLADEAGISLDAGAPGSLPPVHGDVAALTHALRNVLAEAIERAPAGGVVALSVWATLSRVIARATVSGPGAAAGDGRATTVAPASRRLDVARRIAEAQGGELVEGPTARGGCALTLALPRPIAPNDTLAH